VLVSGVAYVVSEQLETSRDRQIRNLALQRAHLANEFGSALPVLTPQKLRSGFSATELASIYAAEERVKTSQPLLGFTIFNRRRRLVYPPAGPIELRVPDGIERALRGSTAVERLGDSGAAVIEASVPIRDAGGNVIGASVVSLDEDALRAELVKEKERLFLTLIGAAALVWLLLLPVSVRLARLAAPHISIERWRTIRDFKRALGSGELEVHYQPKVAIADGSPCGAEGLVRWRRGSQVKPAGEFLRHVEHTDLVHRLTEFVLDRAVADARAWRQAGYDIGVAVNLSARSFEQGGLPDVVRATLAKHGVEPQALTLEVTEKAVFDNPARLESILTELAEIGVSISIDDFGTGHYSLARLHRFPVSEVKIDRVFVGRMTGDERPFVDSMATLVDALGLDVVAEGVEDIATLELLAKTRCRAAQGFFFCRPIPLAEFMEWLAKPHAGDVARLAKLGTDVETASIPELVESARRVSDGEVAWLAHFQDGQQHELTVVSHDEERLEQADVESFPLNHAYCVRMVEGEIPNAISDTRTHPATRDIAGAGDAIGSYVGVPVRLPTGALHGSLCSASRAARQVSPETVRLLSVLAGQIGQRLSAENVRSMGEVESPEEAPRDHRTSS
jgi:EAL domain-containing protein (putative c-di-GMP-specific phosphodiesterase class I)